nr:hypothetical protein [uncultured organism]
MSTPACARCPKPCAWRDVITARATAHGGASAGAGRLAGDFVRTEDRLGWYIFQSRNELYTDRVFAGLGTVIVIGLLFEHLVFRSIETATVGRWGMQR